MPISKRRLAVRGIRDALKIVCFCLPVISALPVYSLEFDGVELRGLNLTSGGTVDISRLNAYHIGWYENIYPRGMYKNNKTHIVYHCYNYDTCLRTYDHQTRQWQTPLLVGSNSIGGFENSHGNPAVLVDDQNNVHVFYGAQQTALKYSRTTTPGDTRTLTPRPVIGDNITYPQPLQLSNGTIFLFHRSAGHGEDYTLRTSADHGNTWSAASPLIEAPGVWYAFSSKGQGDKIHVAFHLYNSEGTANYPREDVYYMYRKPSDGKWYNINNQLVTLPITTIEYADANLKIYDSNGIHTDLDRVRETSDGTIYIGWIEDHSYKFLIHNTYGWQPVRELAFPSEPPLNQADFEVDTSGGSPKIKLYLSIKGGEIARYESTDLGVTFTKTIAQLSPSIHAKKVRVPMIIDDHPPDAELIYYTATNKNEEGALFVWGNTGYILNQAP